MTIYNLGSINADNVYRVSHQPAGGETLAAQSLTRGLGGKGANMSVAAARAAARVVHIGAVGSDGRWASERLLEYGVDTRHIAVSDLPTGHANICVDPQGENTIVLLSGANGGITRELIGAALSNAGPGDIFVTQNETSGQKEAVDLAARLGLRVIYAAAPFDADAVRAVMDKVDMLVLNAVEAAQLSQETGSEPGDLPCSDVVVTMGGDGCVWHSKGQAPQSFPAIPVKPVDTTGAGDTFTGYLIAGLDRGMPVAQAIGLATKAGALMVTREGTADVIPDLKEIEDFTFR
ncbi:ribokinase [uncultured Roseobacter sp.]|uniref:ribokinase n=1 Tax=uncultured Roseobacter sp. TaxID=114847 RepID=UPI002610802A|nr:ribokinase [uncultured Roseobacter sp.]